MQWAAWVTILISCPATSIQPAWCRSAELMDTLNGNKENGMRRQQQLLPGKHSYNPHGFEASVRSDCRSAPHLTGKREMFSFFTMTQGFLVRSKVISLTNLSFSESSSVTKTPRQSCVQKHRLRTLASALRNLNIWASDLPGTGQKRVLYLYQRKTSGFWCRNQKVFKHVLRQATFP